MSNPVNEAKEQATKTSGKVSDQNKPQIALMDRGRKGSTVARNSRRPAPRVSADRKSTSRVKKADSFEEVKNYLDESRKRLTWVSLGTDENGHESWENPDYGFTIEPYYNPSPAEMYPEYFDDEGEEFAGFWVGYANGRLVASNADVEALMFEMDGWALNQGYVLAKKSSRVKKADNTIIALEWLLDGFHLKTVETIAQTTSCEFEGNEDLAGIASDTKSLIFSHRGVTVFPDNIRYEDPDSIERVIRDFMWNNFNPKKSSFNRKNRSMSNRRPVSRRANTARTKTAASDLFFLSDGTGEAVERIFDDYSGKYEYFGLTYRGETLTKEIAEREGIVSAGHVGVRKEGFWGSDQLLELGISLIDLEGNTIPAYSEPSDRKSTMNRSRVAKRPNRRTAGWSTEDYGKFYRSTNPAGGTGWVGPVDGGWAAEFHGLDESQNFEVFRTEQDAQIAVELYAEGHGTGNISEFHDFVAQNKVAARSLSKRASKSRTKKALGPSDMRMLEMPDWEETSPGVWTYDLGGWRTGSAWDDGDGYWSVRLEDEDSEELLSEEFDSFLDASKEVENWVKSEKTASRRASKLPVSRKPLPKAERPKTANTNNNLKLASPVQAMKLADQYIARGLEQGDKYELAEKFARLPEMLVRDRLSLLESVPEAKTVQSKQAERRSVPAGTKREGSVRRSLPSMSSAPKLSQKSDSGDDALLFF